MHEHIKSASDMIEFVVRDLDKAWEESRRTDRPMGEKYTLQDRIVQTHLAELLLAARKLQSDLQAIA